jgi:heme/copper-type cytochrome/quinol oxidase subunit 2
MNLFFIIVMMMMMVWLVSLFLVFFSPFQLKYRHTYKPYISHNNPQKHAIHHHDDSTTVKDYSTMCIQ